jgi:hypothetical protein
MRRGLLIAVAVLACIGWTVRDAQQSHMRAMVEMMSAEEADPVPDYLHYWAFSDTRALTDLGRGYNAAWSSTGGTRQINADGVFFPTDAGYRWLNLPGPVTNTANYTISVWLKPNITYMAGQSAGGWVFSDRSNQEGTKDFQLRYGKSQDRLGVGFFNASDDLDSLNFTTATANDTWVHMVAVVNSATSNSALYMNGSLNTNVTFTPPANDAYAGVATIGAASWTLVDGLLYRGYIDFLRVYQRVLTSNEIAAIWSYEKARSGR